MRKYLIGILIGVIIIILAVDLVNGISIGAFQIKSIGMIKEDNDELEGRIEQINQKQSITYKGLNDELEGKAKELKKQKENYADLILYNSEEENSNLNLYEKYEIEYLWTKLGNYATKNKLTMKLEVTNGSTRVEKLYNLNFTLNGEYVSIIDCISEIEDDSTLGFKIENFKLISDEDNNLNATFTVKNVSINNIDEIKDIQQEENNEDENEQEKNVDNLNKSKNKKNINSINNTTNEINSNRTLL